MPCVRLPSRAPRPVVFLLEPQEVELSFTSSENHNCIVNAVRFRAHRRDSENGEAVFRYSGLSQEVVLSLWRALRQLQTCLTESEFTTRFRTHFQRTRWRC